MANWDTAGHRVRGRKGKRSEVGIHNKDRLLGRRILGVWTAPGRRRSTTGGERPCVEFLVELSGRYERRVAELEGRLRRLEEQLRRDSRNSSSPPSQDPPKTRTDLTRCSTASPRSKLGSKLGASVCSSPKQGRTVRPTAMSSGGTPGLSGTVAWRASWLSSESTPGIRVTESAATRERERFSGSRWRGDNRELAGGSP